MNTPTPKLSLSFQDTSHGSIKCYLCIDGVPGDKPMTAAELTGFMALIQNPAKFFPG